MPPRLLAGAALAIAIAAGVAVLALPPGPGPLAGPAPPASLPDVHPDPSAVRPPLAGFGPAPEVYRRAEESPPPESEADPSARAEPALGRLGVRLVGPGGEGVPDLAYVLFSERRGNVIAAAGRSDAEGYLDLERLAEDTWILCT